MDEDTKLYSSVEKLFHNYPLNLITLNLSWRKLNH